MDCSNSRLQSTADLLLKLPEQQMHSHGSEAYLQASASLCASSMYCVADSYVQVRCLQVSKRWAAATADCKHSRSAIEPARATEAVPLLSARQCIRQRSCDPKRLAGALWGR